MLPFQKNAALWRESKVAAGSLVLFPLGTLLTPGCAGQALEFMTTAGESSAAGASGSDDTGSATGGDVGANGGKGTANSPGAAASANGGGGTTQSTGGKAGSTSVGGVANSNGGVVNSNGGVANSSGGSAGSGANGPACADLSEPCGEDLAACCGTLVCRTGRCQPRDPLACGESVIQANEANNYRFSSRLNLSVVAVKPDSELHFEWGGLSQDFRGLPLEPEMPLDNINVILWRLTLEQLETKLADDTLSMREAEIPVHVPPPLSTTSANLFEFVTAAQEPLSPEEVLPFLSAENYPPEDNTYALIASSGDVTSGGAMLGLQAFKLDPASSNTTVALTNDSTSLTWAVSLSDLQPTPVPPGSTDLILDWTHMETTGLGSEFLTAQITHARIARYDASIPELEASFLGLDRFAAEEYDTVIPAGTHVGFSDFRSESGEEFLGITPEGTWLLGLFCRSCRNPAPWYLTVLRPCAG